VCGIEAAAGDIVVTLDADGSARADEIPRFAAALGAGADFAKGSRHLPGGGSADLTPIRSFGNRFLGLVVKVLFGYEDLRLNGRSKLRQLQDGMRILRTILEEPIRRRGARFPERLGEPVPETC
jgi:hypothetical protein